MLHTFYEALAESGASVLMRGFILTDSQTLNEVNRMKVKSEYRTELRGIVNEYIKDNVGAEEFLAELLKSMSVDQIANFVEDSIFYEDLDYLFKERPSTIAVEKIEQAWKDVGMADFGILCVRYEHPEDIEEDESEDRTPQEIFFLMCDDMEILCDELSLKMKEFKPLVEEIVGFPIEIDFDGFGTGEHLGEVSTVTGRAK